MPLAHVSAPRTSAMRRTFHALAPSRRYLRGVPMTSFVEFERAVRAQPGEHDAAIAQDPAVTRIHRAVAADVARDAHTIESAGGFGSAGARRAFMIDRRWPVFISHGAFGGTLRCAYRAAEHWRRLNESQPLRFYDRLMLPALAAATADVASFLATQPAEVALTQNVTSALCGLVRSLARDRTRPILLLATTYSSVRTMARLASDVPPIEVPVTLPHSEAGDALVDRVRAALAQARQRGQPVQLALIEHVASDSALVQPLAALAAACAAEGVPVLADGAHGPLAQDLGELDRAHLAYYVGSLHKWVAAPKGVAFVWRGGAAAGAPAPEPAIVSHGYGAGTLHSRLAWDGTRDYSAQLAAPAALALWRRLGTAEVRRYMCGLAGEAAAELLRAWHDGREGAPARALAPLGLAPSVTLPLPPYVARRWAALAPGDAANAVQDWLHDRHGIEVAVKAIAGALHVRVSAHVYNALADYARLAEAIKQLKD